jgi:hypothetical protein
MDKKYLKLVHPTIVLLISVELVVVCEGFELMNRDIYYMVGTLCLTIYSMRRGRWVPIHPLVCLPPFILLYHFSAVLADIIGIASITHNYQVSLVGFLATSSYIFVAILCGVNREKEFSGIRKISAGRKFNTLTLNLSYISILLICSFYLMYVRSLGVTSKAEFLSSGVIYPAGFFGILNTITLAIAVIPSRTSKTIKSLYIISTLSVFLFALLIMGERDFLLRLVFGLGSLAYMYGTLNKKLILGGGFSTLILIPLLSTLKGFIISGQMRQINQGVFLALVGGEFRSAGRNLDVLFRKRFDWDYQYGYTLLQDIFASLIPSQLYEIVNPTTWFRYKMFPELAASGRGKGFSLAAEGFLNFGLVGVTVWFSLLAFLLSRLYYFSRWSYFGIILYISTIPLAIYALRADFANIISPLLKHVLIPMCIMVIGTHVVATSVRSVR